MTLCRTQQTFITPLQTQGVGDKLRNLERISLHEYAIKLEKTRYPLVRSDQLHNGLVYLDQTEFRHHKSPSPYRLTVYQKLLLMDFFNTTYQACEFCNIPYSYGRRVIGPDEYQVCMPCHIITHPKPTSLYVAMDDNSTIVSTHQISVKIFNFDTILSTDEEGLLDELVGKLREQTQLTDRRLDDYF